MVLHLINWLDSGKLDFRPQSISTECSLYPKIRTAPPTINGRRPDLFALSKNPGCCLIGEAKTTKDLDTDRTESQLRAFVRHLTEIGSGYIVLGVTWNNIPTAKSILRKVVNGEGATEVTPLAVDCSLSLMRSDMR